MTLLLAILLSAPLPHPDVPTLEIVPPSRTITLQWDNSPTPGCSNRLYYWEKFATNEVVTHKIEVVRVTNNVAVTETKFVTEPVFTPVGLKSFDVGTTNRVHVNVDTVRRYYTVRAVLNEVESPPCNTLKYPGDTVREFYAVKPDGSKVTLGTTTNTPPGDSGYFRVNWMEWVNYDQP